MRRNPDPHCSVILVIDVPVYSKETATPILGVVRRTIDSCRAQNIPVVHTHDSQKDPSDYGILGEWCPNGNLHDATPEMALLLEVDRTTDKIVYKHTYGGYYNTDLVEYLVSPSLMLPDSNIFPWAKDCIMPGV